MKKYLSLLCAITLLLSAFVIQIPIHAASTNNTTYKVSTIENLQYTVSTAVAGDTIILANGTYDNVGNITLGNDRGALGNEITIKPASAGGVKFTGKVCVLISGTYIKFTGFYFDSVQHDATEDDDYRHTIVMDDATYCDISDNYFYKCGSTYNMGVPSKNNGSASHILLVIHNSNHNTIQNNTFEASISSGIGIKVLDGYDTSYNLIKKNYFKDVPKITDIWGKDVTNGMECIQINQNVEDSSREVYTTVENNLFENVIGEGAEIISVKCSNNIIRGNTFRDCASMITLRQGNNNLVDGNFMINVRGIRLYGKNHIIRNNYIANCEIGLNIDGGDGTSHYAASTNVQVYNNTVLYPSKTGISLNGYKRIVPATGIDLKNNYVYTDAGVAYDKNGECIYTDGNNLYTAVSTGTNKISTCTSISDTEAHLVLASDGVYRQSSDSSLINAGQSITGLVYDIDGQTRTRNPDVGADEYIVGGSTIFPLTSVDAGITWGPNKQTTPSTSEDGEQVKEDKENNGKSKVIKDKLEAKKQERAEAKIETKEYVKVLKSMFKDADPETKKEILKEIAVAKKEMNDLSIGAFVKGLNVDFDKYDGVEPLIKDGRTLVPVRAITEALDAEVTWNEATSTITIKKDDTIIVMHLNNKIAKVNGVEVELDVAPTTINDRTVVPIRFISEALKLNVEWDDDSQTVVIE